MAALMDSLALKEYILSTNLPSLSYSIVFVAVTVGVTSYFLCQCTAGGVCRSKALLNGKTVIITGANGGIGKETAVDLARRNARVIMADIQGGEETAADVRKRSGNDNVVFRYLNLASFTSIRQFAARILEEELCLDILINNAGISSCPYRKTEDGFEMQFGVNHLGHFLLTNLLLERLKEAPSARIVVVSSIAHRFGKIRFHDLNSEKSYNKFRAYYQSKLANVLFTRFLAKRLEGTNVTVNALHPGFVRTGITRHAFTSLLERVFGVFFHMVGLLLFKNPQQGAQTSIYCAVSEEMEGVSGKYLVDCKIRRLTTPAATDDEAAERLWRISAKMVGLDCS